MTTMNRRSRLTLGLLILVCTLPVAASYLAFYVWQPAGTVNYGELLPPRGLPEAGLTRISAQAPEADGLLRGRWTLLLVAPAGCDAACRDALYTMRQARLAQGKEQERVARLWLITDAREPDAALLREHAGLELARASSDWLARFRAEDEVARIHLVDPLGNLMMRFPAEADPKRVFKDLQRLLKYSGLG